MKKVQEQQKLTIVINAMEAAGYNPRAQLTGYMITGDTAYITRQGGARKMIGELDRNVIGSYLAAGGRTFSV